MFINYSIDYIIEQYLFQSKQIPESFKHIKTSFIESLVFSYGWFIDLSIFRKTIRAFDDKTHDL